MTWPRPLPIYFSKYPPLVGSIPVVNGPVVYDTFNDVNTTALTAHEPNIKPVGASWAHVAGTFAINASNRAAWASNTGAYALAAIESGKADCVVSGIVQRNAGGYAGLAVRVVDVNNYIIITINAANQFQAIRRFGGAAAVLQTVSITTAQNTDYAVEITLSGTSIKAKLDGVDRIDTTYVNLTTATKHGLYGEVASQFDNFQVV